MLVIIILYLCNLGILGVQESIYKIENKKTVKYKYIHLTQQNNRAISYETHSSIKSSDAHCKKLKQP